jgi:rhomboid protease GluP
MAMLRRLKEDFQEFPATMALGTLWVVVFVMMIVNQSARSEGLSPSELIIGLRNGHRFGDLTLHELYAGEIWRSLTATFVHYGVLHIGMNLWALYQLGCLVESWYGAGPFLGIYVLTGGGGNLISALIRHALRSNPMISSGGGSTVVMGLVGLAAVVGWRSRTRIGDHLRNQMIWVIGLTAGIGLAFQVGGMPVIDNWGHAGGTLMGALIGLANRGLVRYARGKMAWVAGVLGVSVLAACGWAQVKDDRAEDVIRRQVVEAARKRSANDEMLLVRIGEIRQLYKAVAAPHAIRRGNYVAAPPHKSKLTAPPKPPAKAASPAPAPAPASSASASQGVLRLEPEQELYLTVVNAALRALISMSAYLDDGSMSSDYRRARQILGQSMIEPPTLAEVHEFDERMAAIFDRIRQDRDVAGQMVLQGETIRIN